MRVLIFSFLSFIFSTAIFCQQTEDAVVVLTTNVDAATPSVTLEWSTQASTNELLLIRQEKGDPIWYLLLDTVGQVPTSFTDNLVDVGKTYEYAMVQSSNGISSFGYVSVPIEAPLADSRGTMLVFVEEALQTPLANELERLEADLVGDGWKVIWHEVASDASVATVKSQIVADYNADPDHVKSVFLFGEIPVPYSGNTNWDGHADHQGAWVADTYYADMDGVWTDITVNNTTPSRAANDNVPGDGKFDQSITPSSLELAVGRVDFSNLSETTFGASRTELLRRYLDKNHRWRNKLYTVQNQALVDDNFGYFSGEAFAANGYRNFYPLVGFDNVVDGDFFDSTDDQSFLFGYGCGGGSYTSAGGVGNSNDFATDSINVVFSMLFGSYHGDWDSENNPFMMSALASKGGILSCSWAGRPHWFYHPFAAGETLGSCTVRSQNTCDIPGYFNSFGNCGAHVTLLGDPSLRAHVVAPIADLAATNLCHTVELSWAASTAPDLLGYHVYRANAMNGSFERLTTMPIPATSFSDDDPLLGDNVYQVRAVVMEQTLNGSYTNASTGVFISTNFQTGTPPMVDAMGGVLTCTETSVDVFANTDANSPTFDWTGPNGFSQQGQTVSVGMPGVYFVTATDGMTGCTATATAEVTLDDSLPTATPMTSGELNCTNDSIQLAANPGNNVSVFSWTGPNGFSSMEENPIVGEPGSYSLTVSSDNGCSAVFSTDVTENTLLPAIDIAPASAITCAVSEVSLMATVFTNGDNYSAQWTTLGGQIVSGANTLSPTVGICGTYELTVLNEINGCTSTASAMVLCDFDLPDLNVTGETHIPCFGTTTTIEAVTTTGATVQWIGLPNPNSTTQVVSAGEYEVVAAALNGCTVSETVIVTEESPIEISYLTTVDCNGITDPTVNVSGGVAPYSILITPSPPLPPNTDFSIIVGDTNGCQQVLSGTTPLFEPITVAISHTDETVAGFNDGTATAEPSNGVPPFAFLWSNGETSQMITDLEPGFYFVSATDAFGCQDIAFVEIMAGLNATIDLPGLLSLELFPNPTDGRFSIDVTLNQVEAMSVTVSDMIGREVLRTEEVVVHKQSWHIDLGGHAAGIYLCKIKVGEGVLTRKVVLY